MKRYLAAASLALALMAGPAHAQQTEDEIVVTGQRLHDMIVDFVGEIAVAPPAEQQLARWDDRICPGVIGIQARYGQYLVDTIARRAHEVGIETEEAGCKANVIIFVTPDSQALARNIVDEFKQLTGYYHEDNQHTLGRGELEAFAETQRPVRWWHITETTGAQGTRLNTHGGGAAHLRTFSPSRLRRATRQDLGRVIIIVDATRAQGMRFDALADYVAMASLAQLDPDADTSAYPTILNLFSDQDAGRTPPEAMTDWDKSYLEGLYAARRDAPNSHWQERDIARTMDGGVTGAQH